MAPGTPPQVQVLPKVIHPRSTNLRHHVDNQVESCWLLDGKVTRLGTFEYAVHKRMP
jgi:hypothetical protein